MNDLDFSATVFKYWIKFTFIFVKVYELQQRAVLSLWKDLNFESFSENHVVSRSMQDYVRSMIVEKECIIVTEKMVQTLLMMPLLLIILRIIIIE